MRSERKVGRSERVVYMRRNCPPRRWPNKILPPDIPRQPEIVWSTGSSWEEIGAAYSKVVDERVDLSLGKSLLSEIVGEAKAPREVTARVLGHAVRRIIDARDEARKKGHTTPGQAELIDQIEPLLKVSCIADLASIPGR